MLLKNLRLSEAVFRSAYSKIREVTDAEPNNECELVIQRQLGVWVEEIGLQDMLASENFINALNYDEARVINRTSNIGFTELLGSSECNVIITERAPDIKNSRPMNLSDKALFQLAQNAGQNIAVLYEGIHEITIVRLFMGDAFKCVMICTTGSDADCVLSPDDVPYDDQMYENSNVGKYAKAYLPDWDQLRWLTFGESMADGDNEIRWPISYPTITTYCYESDTMIQWAYHIEGNLNGTDRSMVIRYDANGRLAEVKDRADALIPEKALANIMSDVDIYKMYLDDKRARRMNAMCIPRPRPDLWTTNATIEQYINREPVARVEFEEPRRFVIHQFHPYTNGGYDVANNKVRVDSAHQALIETLNWKFFAESIRFSSAIVRVGIVVMKAQWVSDDGIHVNKYSDIALDVCVSYDKHFRPDFVIIQLKPIEKFNPVMADTDVYKYDDGRLVLAESIGLRKFSMGILAYFETLENSNIMKTDGFTINDWLTKAIRDKSAEVRKLAATDLRQSFAKKPNVRVVQGISDGDLLSRYHIVPTTAIASKLKYVSCAVITKQVFQEVEPMLLEATYSNRLECLFGISSWVRDSLAMKLLVKNRDSNSERNATEEDALKWCSSYTIPCQYRDELRISPSGVVKLPCGFLTTDYNGMMNKHACVRHLMGIRDSQEGTVHIHGAYKCGSCKTIYQSNISALVCNYRCKT